MSRYNVSHAYTRV